MPSDEDIKELKKELKKLKPETRLKRLKELGDKRKAEITEIEDLITDSEKEMKTDEVAEEIAPEQSEVDIGRLFEEDGDQLESTVRKEAPEPKEEDSKYASFKQAYSDYSTLQDISYAGTMGPVTPAQMEVVDKIGERLDRTKYVSASQEVANILVASRSTLYKIRKYAGLE